VAGNGVGAASPQPIGPLRATSPKAGQERRGATGGGRILLRSNEKRGRLRRHRRAAGYGLDFAAGRGWCWASSYLRLQTPTSILSVALQGPRLGKNGLSGRGRQGSQEKFVPMGASPPTGQRGGKTFVLHRARRQARPGMYFPSGLDNRLPGCRGDVLALSVGARRAAFVAGLARRRELAALARI